MKIFMISVLFILAFTQCKTANQSQNNSSKTLASSGSGAQCEDIQNVRSFRDIFYHVAKNNVEKYPLEYLPKQLLARGRGFGSSRYSHKKLTDQDIQKMIYFPPNQAICLEESHMRRTSSDNVAYLNDMEYSLTQIPEANLTKYYFERGQREPVGRVSNSRAVFDEKGPATVIVIPGFVAEFFDPIPFQQVMNAKKSVFRDGKTNGGRGPTLQAIIDQLGIDKVWSDQKYQDVETKMSDLVQVSSLDAGNKALVNLIFMPSPRGSLETIGTTRHISEIYLRRLNKFFSRIKNDPGLVEQTRNIYLMGYSRGHLTSMDLAVLLDQKKPWWSANGRLKGVINLAGVVYGTAMASDGLIDENSATYKMIKSIEKVNDQLAGLEFLEGNPSIADKLKRMHKNHDVLTGAIMSQLRGFPVEANPNIENEQKMLGSRFRGGVTAVNPMHVLSLLTSMRKKVINVTNFLHPVPKVHFTAISSWKKLFGDLIVGMEAMTKRSRVKWFENNVLPDINYFSVTGSMPDKLVSGVKGLLSNPNYSSGGSDFRMLRGNYYTMLDQTKLQVNDSQVTYPMARYWPGLFARLNPRQGKRRSYYLGMVGTHHWGIAWTTAFKQTGGSVNNFPKTILLESLATYALQKQ